MFFKEERKSEGSVSEAITASRGIQRLNHFLLWKIRCVLNYITLLPFSDFLKFNKNLLDLLELIVLQEMWQNSVILSIY